MTIQEFEVELKQIDPRLSIVPNPNRPLLANIKLAGVDVCPIPAHDIRDEYDPNYTIELPNGVRVPHKSKAEALAMVEHTLRIIQDPATSDAFFSKNG